MTAEHTATRLSVDVYLDLICPWCWIGLRSLRTAIQALQRHSPDLAVQLVWHAAPLQPQIPDEGVDFQAFYLARLGSPAAVQARRAQVNAVAQSVGLRIDFEAMTTFAQSRLACALVEQAQTRLSIEQMFALLESLYAAYFSQGQNIGRPEVLQRLAQAAGVPWDAARMAAQPAGAHSPSGGVPLFVFNHRQAVSGAAPAAELLQAMAQAAALEQPLPPG
ncbi:MAG: DsbA family oxidoreductase [Pseudomonadota bacterium]|nr:DsbA family oxidoreductase [Pseudomonadota bacterium]